MKSIKWICIVLLPSLLMLSAGETFAAGETHVSSRQVQRINRLLDEVEAADSSDLPQEVRNRLLDLAGWDDDAFRIFELNKKHKDLTLLLAAARYGNLRLFTRVLNRHPDYQAVKEQLLLADPVDLALVGGSPEIVRLMVETWGRDILFSREEDPVVVAASHGHLKLVNYLLTLQGQGDLTARQAEAVRNRGREKQEQDKARAVSRAQLAEKIAKNLPPVPSSSPTTPAVPNGILPLLEEMASSPQTDVTLYLGRILAAARRDAETTRILTSQLQNKEIALLLLAAKYDHVELLKRLLKKYPDYPPLADKFIFDRPLYQALSSGSIRAARLLLATWGPRQLTEVNERILLQAVKTGSAELVEDLLAAGEEWDSFFDGDPVVMAISLGYPEVAKVFMLEQGKTRLSDEQANKIFAKAMTYPPQIAVAEALVDVITEARQEDLYYAAALGNEKITFALCSLPGIDITAPARSNFFSEVETRGKTADEIARAFGHQLLADELKVKKELARKQQQRLAAEQRAREELELRQKQVAQKNAEKDRNRERILARETPYSGSLRTAIYFRYLGFKGERRSKEDNAWHRFQPSDEENDALLSLALKTGFPLRLDYWGNHPDLILYVSRKRGRTRLSAMTNEVYLYSGNQELLSFSFEKRGDTSLAGIAPILLQKLEEEIEKRSELFDALVAQRNRREISRIAKLKQNREQQHEEAMLSLRQKIREQNYPAALELSEQIDEQGIYQSEKLDFIKATLLHKAGRDTEARRVLELYLVEYADSESTYLARAKALLQKLEKSP